VSFGSSVQAICGQNSTVCTLLPAGRYGGVSYPANQVLRISNPTAAGSYPLTLTAVPPSWVDLEGNRVVLNGSDTVLEAVAITGRPTMVSASADASTDVVLVRYPEGVECNGAGHAQFAYLEDGNPIPLGATSLVCDGTTTLRLTFPDGGIQVGDVNPVLRYRESSVSGDRIRDLAAQPVASGEHQAMVVEP